MIDEIKGYSMTLKVFWQNPYQSQLISKVIAINGHQIELEETIFYAESGGQESDAGTIAGISVLEAKKQNQSIIYTLSSIPAFGVGELVETRINWERRYALMKLHFAAEVVLEIFFKEYPLMQKIGAHISPTKSRIDFEWPQSISPLLVGIQLKAQALIDSNLEIESDFENESEQKRYWRVEGFAKVPCGGTHLRSTQEVGQIRLKRKNTGKGKERVEISLL